MKDIFKNIPWWAWLIILAVIIYGVYRLIKYLTVTLPQSKNYTATVTNANTELNNLASQGISPSLPQANYNGMANALQTTFTGCGIDWNGVIVPTFQQMKNDADVYALISNYGVRTFDECGWGSFTGDLASALAYKLSFTTLDFNPSDLFNDRSVAGVNKILKQNGLTYQF